MGNKIQHSQIGPWQITDVREKRKKLIWRWMFVVIGVVFVYWMLCGLIFNSFPRVNRINFTSSWIYQLPFAIPLWFFDALFIPWTALVVLWITKERKNRSSTSSLLLFLWFGLAFTILLIEKVNFVFLALFVTLLLLLVAVIHGCVNIMDHSIEVGKAVITDLVSAVGLVFFPVAALAIGSESVTSGGITPIFVFCSVIYVTFIPVLVVYLLLWILSLYLPILKNIGNWLLGK